ncbi:YggS family pyridoxal phosphate-dependent enzyme [Macrococcus caseolyticus]|uniref:YggS family pyridoxal phosphate-dependent enzyme n=1 Tax=Macrococcoides caseolyticum TaxID=69966 RepID=UPI0011A0070B|nr:YggS family pyridoxal phosphate-dependent enzyme [Macrococcus caseolyticus]MDJ1088664.1 YggS family pyridoxal phosphate-dependent enzyme [Macrococcus caseolyticus]MDJ1090036.1 YggS family pyridoxal phosphate-dependent enzyme [Macrococcus caseolyticus]
MEVRKNLDIIKQEIESALQKSADHKAPTIIAVTKYVTIDRAKEAMEAGICHLGENRIEGFLEKREALDDATMHFIGTLQSRKVKEVINQVDYLHSLDRLSLAKEIDKRAEKTIKCFVQVNVSDEQSKHGIKRDEVMDFIHGLASYSQIVVVGLMTMAPAAADESELRRYFKTMKQLQLEVQNAHLSYAPCTELSMGMSNDYQIAVEEGATFIRIGTKLVG